MDGAPVYIVDVKQPGIYHPINWDRHGSYCDLALNEQRTYHKTIPDGTILCPICKERMDDARKSS